MDSTDIKNKIKQLPPEMQSKVRRYVDSLLAKNNKTKGITKREPDRQGRRLRLDWAGGLRELRGKFTSLELQHKAMDWWGGA